MSLTLAAADPQMVYQAWLGHQNSNTRLGIESISASASTSYRYIWQSWLKFLARSHPEPDAWVHATPETVISFLSSGMLRLKSGVPSETSKRRYWRLLSRIYTYALQNGWVSANPFLALAIAETPPVEQPKGAVLIPKLLQACYVALPAHLGTPLQARDRAMALLIMSAAVTPQEIRAMCISDLQTDPATGKITMLHIPALRSAHQQRTIALDATTSEALSYWITQRYTMPSLLKSLERAPTHLSQSDLRPAQARLFISQKSPSVTMETLLYVCSNLIKRACAEAELPPPARLGPQVLRNTAIVNWLNKGIPAADVARMAGLKNVKGLYHLRELVSPVVRADLAVGNKRDDAP